MSAMTFSLSCSSLGGGGGGGGKPFHSQQSPSKPRQRKPMFISVSCRSRSATESLTSQDKCTTDFYTLLSLNPYNASIDQIKRAYRNMALKYHPDVCHSSASMNKAEATRVFVQLHDAYTTLSDPVLREKYDSKVGLFGKVGKTFQMDVNDGDDQSGKKRWQHQVLHLKMRSRSRMPHKEGSWGTSMRARNLMNVQ